jgi:hypothetical protein
VFNSKSLKRLMTRVAMLAAITLSALLVGSSAQAQDGDWHQRQVALRHSPPSWANAQWQRNHHRDDDRWRDEHGKWHKGHNRDRHGKNDHDRDDYRDHDHDHDRDHRYH